jgi:glycosyltransferase involved in cell wall biosynthesis
VLALLPDKRNIGGCTYVRLTGPLAILKQMGHHIDWMPHEYARLMAMSGQGQVTSYDVIVVPRVGEIGDGRMLTLVKLLRAAGKCVIYETDDDYTNEYRQVLAADAVAVMDECTAITVSTPHLREQCAKYTSRPIFLLQNCIDLDWWDSVEVERTVPSVSVGVIGTMTHYEDWKLAKDAMYRIGREYPDVHFVVGGLFPDYLQDLPNLHHLDFVPFEQYPQMVGQIDIGLCPLIGDDKFNMSKSAIKAMEYWASGAAVVASDCSVYNRALDNDRGFLASTTEEWYRAIKFYLDHPEERRVHALAGREWIRKNRNMEYNCQFWWDVYTEVFQEYGGKIDVDFIAEWSVGDRPADGKGKRGDHVLSVPRPRRKRRARDSHRTNAARGRRRAPSRRGA